MRDPAAIDDLWRRLEAHFRRNAPALIDALRPAAAVEAVVHAELALGAALPPDFVASLGRHDGQDLKAPAVLGAWSLLPLSQVVHKWWILGDSAGAGRDSPDLRSEGPVRPRPWDHRWIPFSSSSYGDYLALDLDPPSGGSRGQIVSWSANEPRRAVVAPSFGAWLAGILERLEHAR